MAANDLFAVHRLPPGLDPAPILDEALITARNIRQLTMQAAAKQAIRLLIFSPDEETGRELLKRSRTRHATTGLYDADQRIIALSGSSDDPRFWTVLRHETVHALLHDAIPAKKIPFWLDEGLATWFEQPQNDVAGGWPMSVERLRFVQHHLRSGKGLGFRALLAERGLEKNGAAYARAWAMVGCLMQRKNYLQTYIAVLQTPSINDDNQYDDFFKLHDGTLETFESSCSQFILTQQLPSLR